MLWVPEGFRDWSPQAALSTEAIEPGGVSFHDELLEDPGVSSLSSVYLHGRRCGIKVCGSQNPNNKPLPTG